MKASNLMSILPAIQLISWPVCGLSYCVAVVAGWLASFNHSVVAMSALAQCNGCAVNGWLYLIIQCVKARIG